MKIRIKHILRCYQSGMSTRSISSSLQVSRNTAKRYIHAYKDMGIELERLLKMDDQHLHELFCVNIDNESSKSAGYKYLEGRIPEYIKRLKSRGTTRRSLHEEYLKERPGGYSYRSFCLYFRREKEIRVPVGHIDHMDGAQMYVDFADDKLISQTKTQVTRFLWKSLPPYFRAARLFTTRLYHHKRKNILFRDVKMPFIILVVYLTL